MPKYIVSVARDRTEYSDLEVEADNPNAACDKAMLAVEHNSHLMSWTLDTESIVGKPYVADAPTEVPIEPVFQP